MYTVNDALRDILEVYGDINGTKIPLGELLIHAGEREIKEILSQLEESAYTAGQDTPQK